MNAPAKVTKSKPKGETVEDVLDEMDKRAADNLRLWNSLGRTDPGATKPITGKRFGGTAIKPMWINKRLTEQFGPCGIGWGMDRPEFELVHGQDGQVLVFCTAKVWYQEGDHTHFSYGVGGDFVIKNESTKPFFDDEAYKKAYTDALNNAWKFVGVAADVHMGLFDDSKYVAEVNAEFHPKPDPPLPEDRGRAEGDMAASALKGSLRMLVHNINGCATVQDLEDLLATDDAKEVIENCERRFPAWYATGEGMPAEFVPLKTLIAQTREGLKGLQREDA